MLNQAGDRLGIPRGTPWSVTSEGKAVQVGPTPPQPEGVVDKKPEEVGRHPEDVPKDAPSGG